MSFLLWKRVVNYQFSESLQRVIADRMIDQFGHKKYCFRFDVEDLYFLFDVEDFFFQIWFDSDRNQFQRLLHVVRLRLFTLPFYLSGWRSTFDLCKKVFPEILFFDFGNILSLKAFKKLLGVDKLLIIGFWSSGQKAFVICHYFAIFVIY